MVKTANTEDTMAKVPQILSDISGTVIDPNDAARIRVYVGTDDYVLDVTRAEAMEIASKGTQVKRRGKPAKAAK
jgi:hypothetical protein